MEIKIFGKGNIDNINKLENKFGVKLPNDYKESLINNNGGIIKNGAFYVGELKQKILMDKLFGINLDKNVFNLEHWNEKYKDELLEKTIIIGMDAGGAFIIMVLDGKDDGIYFYDHTYYFEQSTDEKNVYFICKTFSEFMEMLENNN